MKVFSKQEEYKKRFVNHEHSCHHCNTLIKLEVLDLEAAIIEHSTYGEYSVILFNTKCPICKVALRVMTSFKH